MTFIEIWITFASLSISNQLKNFQDSNCFSREYYLPFRKTVTVFFRKCVVHVIIVLVKFFTQTKCIHFGIQVIKKENQVNDKI